MIPSVQYPVLKVPVCGDGPRGFPPPALPALGARKYFTGAPRRCQGLFSKPLSALGRSASPPVPVRPCLRAGMYITHNPEAAQWVIFQFLDTPQFLHIYSIDLFLVEIDV